jgi:hypothetical protein
MRASPHEHPVASHAARPGASAHLGGWARLDPHQHALSSYRGNSQPSIRARAHPPAEPAATAVPLNACSQRSRWTAVGNPAWRTPELFGPADRVRGSTHVPTLTRNGIEIPTFDPITRRQQ